MTIEQWISAASLIVTVVLLIITISKKSGAESETLSRLVQFKHTQENLNQTLDNRFMPRQELEHRLKRNERDIRDLTNRLNRDGNWRDDDLGGSDE